MSEVTKITKMGDKEASNHIQIDESVYSMATTVASTPKKSLMAPYTGDMCALTGFKRTVVMGFSVPRI